MKYNLMFLLIAISLSVLSKILQLVFKSKAGDVLVILAAIFFVLALLFSIDRFIALTVVQPNIAWKIAFLCRACGKRPPKQKNHQEQILVKSLFS